MKLPPPPPSPLTSSKAAEWMRKMGWSEGKGLGKKEDGMSSYVRVSFKNDTLGVGAKTSPVPVGNNWWERAYDRVVSKRDELPAREHEEEKKKPTSVLDDLFDACGKVGFSQSATNKQTGKLARLQAQEKELKLERKRKLDKTKKKGVTEFSDSNEMSEQAESDAAIFDPEAADQEKKKKKKKRKHTEASSDSTEQAEYDDAILDAEADQEKKKKKKTKRKQKSDEEVPVNASTSVEKSKEDGREYKRKKKGKEEVSACE